MLGAAEVLGHRGSLNLHDLPGSSVAHALLTCSLIGSHLKANNIFSRLYLLVAEVSLVLLSFPATCHWKCHLTDKSNLISIWCSDRWSNFKGKFVTYLKNQLGSPLYVPSSLVMAKLPRADRVLCTAARSLAVPTHVQPQLLTISSTLLSVTLSSAQSSSNQKRVLSTCIYCCRYWRMRRTEPHWPSQRSTVWNISVLVTPYFSAALRNWEICSICLKAMLEPWIFFTGLSPVNRLLISSLRTWRETTRLSDRG